MVVNNTICRLQTVLADQHCIVVCSQPVTAVDEDGLLQGHPETVVGGSLNS